MGQDMDSSPGFAAQHIVWGIDRFASLYRRQVTAIYRYHLIRSGEAAEAEVRTAQTFHTAWQWI